MTKKPTLNPTPAPTEPPSTHPSPPPTCNPSAHPTALPTITDEPTLVPSMNDPTPAPTPPPTPEPTSGSPTPPPTMPDTTPMETLAPADLLAMVSVAHGAEEEHPGYVEANCRFGVVSHEDGTNSCLPTFTEQYKVDLKAMEEYIHKKVEVGYKAMANRNLNGHDLAYHKIENWIHVEETGDGDVKTITNYLQLSEQEIIDYLESEHAPWQTAIANANAAADMALDEIRKNLQKANEEAKKATEEATVVANEIDDLLEAASAEVEEEGRDVEDAATNAEATTETTTRADVSNLVPDFIEVLEVHVNEAFESAMKKAEEKNITVKKIDYEVLSLTVVEVKDEGKGVVTVPATTTKEPTVIQTTTTAKGAATSKAVVGFALALLGLALF